MWTAGPCASSFDSRTTTRVPTQEDKRSVCSVARTKKGQAKAEGGRWLLQNVFQGIPRISIDILAHEMQKYNPMPPRADIAIGAEKH